MDFLSRRRRPQPRLPHQSQIQITRPRQIPYPTTWEAPARSLEQASRTRCRPLGPLRTGLLLILGEFDAPLFAGNLPSGISLDASTLFVSFRKASLGLRNYLAIWGGRLPVSLLAVGHPNNMERPRPVHR